MISKDFEEVTHKRGTIVINKIVANATKVKQIGTPEIIAELYTIGYFNLAVKLIELEQTLNTLRLRPDFPNLEFQK